MRLAASQSLRAASLRRALRRRSVWLSALVTGLGLAVAAFVWHQLAAQRLQAAEQSLSSLQARPNTATHPLAPIAELDFVQHLPSATSVEAIVRDLQRSGSAAGVTLVSVDAGTREPTERTLGRVEAVTLLRGSYAGIKAVLSQVLDRHANLLVQRLSLRRLNGPADVEASVTLLQLARALPSSDTPR